MFEVLGFSIFKNTVTNLFFFSDVLDILNLKVVIKILDLVGLKQCFSK